ncbi:MAG: hypothetical protein JRF50_00750 [Deltaproteobacteria bacterium]|nr:hypothetical protein [Deltaproteobacteria bacterium]
MDIVQIKKKARQLEKALSPILGDDEATGRLSQLLAYASLHDTVCYQEIRDVVEDDPEDILLMAEEWRLLLPVRTAKSSSWEDRLLLARDGEVYKMPNVIRYLAKEAIQSAKWYPEKAMKELFKELRDPAWKQIPGLIKAIAEKAIDNKINGNQIKKICLQFGLSNRVDGLIAELKAAGIMSPKLGSIPDVMGAGSPIYELNPSIVVHYKGKRG